MSRSAKLLHPISSLNFIQAEAEAIPDIFAVSDILAIPDGFPIPCFLLNSQGADGKLKLSHEDQ